MVFADYHDFGPEPVTLLAIDWLCAGVSAVSLAYDIDLSAKVAGTPYYGEPPTYTHAEAANSPGSPEQYENYYVTGERWDFATLVPLPLSVNLRDVNPSIVGDALRRRERLYKMQLKAIAL